MISTNGVTTEPWKIEVASNWQTWTRPDCITTKVSALQSFQCFSSFYQDFKKKKKFCQVDCAVTPAGIDVQSPEVQRNRVFGN